MMFLNLMLQINDFYVPHNQRKEILLGLRNDLDSMRKKANHEHFYTSALLKCLPVNCTLKC